MFELNRHGAVHVLTMNDGQNLMDSDFFNEFDAMLDHVEAASTTDAALVLTGAGKYFSNGLNLPVVSKLPKDEFARFGATLMRCMGRLLVFPVPTVAALNGHAFAGGDDDQDHCPLCRHHLPAQRRDLYGSAES